jgi:hypothetical protein
VLQYDEAELVRRLTQVPRPARVMFAAACAERLLPLYRRFHDLTSQGDPDALAATLDAVWRVALAGMDQEGLARRQEMAESLVPDEDDSWTPESAYGQHGAAAVAYAVRTWLADNPAEAGWAARQVYEAADYAALQRYPDIDLNAPGAERELLAQPVVQEALAGLAADLAVIDGADHEPAGVAARLREQAHEGGERLARLAVA